MRKTLNLPSIHSMPKFSLLLLILVYYSHTQVRICGGVPPVPGLNSAKDGELGAMVERVCSGKIGECSELTMDEEEMMGSESNRRVMLLLRKSYISYETLKRDLVPCDRPGASYYNCKGPGVANSYNRGCEVITRCARGD